MRPRGTLVVPVAIASGIAVAGLMITNDVRNPTPADVSLVLIVGWSFVASGVIAWRLRPGNLIGPVMIVIGFLRFVAALGWSQEPVLFSIGRSLQAAYLAALAYLLLAFPTGRLTYWVERSLFGVLAVAAGPLHAAWLMFAATSDHSGCVGCPDYVFGIVEAPTVARAFEVTHEVLGVVAGLLTLGVLIDRWRRASAARRFAVAPILWVGAVALVAALLWMTSGLLGDPLGRIPAITMELTIALVAVAFLAGVARTRFARGGVADLVIELGDSPAPGHLQTALGEALHDPSLRVVYWLPDEERFVDDHGHTFDLASTDGQVATMIERDGRRIAALVHDPATLEDSQLVNSVRAAVALQLENERLQAELRAHLEEVEASRARIVEAAQEERRRIERDLHDGTQQRLVSIAMMLGLADSQLSSDPAGAATLVKDAKGQLTDTLRELRDLSQGIYPAILRERGLPAAVADLAQRVDMPVAVNVSLSERLPERVEEAAYYVVSEAVTNIIKHARATHARVAVDCLGGVAVICISDDGIGGADTSRGSGLRGLHDRVDALGGQLAIVSPPAGGTLLEARVPCGS